MAEPLDRFVSRLQTRRVRQAHVIVDGLHDEEREGRLAVFYERTTPRCGQHSSHGVVATAHSNAASASEGTAHPLGWHGNRLAFAKTQGVGAVYAVLESLPETPQCAEVRENALRWLRSEGEEV